VDRPGHVVKLPKEKTMDILLVLERFAALNQSEQAWVMTTLLDFRGCQQATFERKYGAYVVGLIDNLVKEAA
jgi:hypothetical protein